MKASEYKLFLELKEKVDQEVYQARTNLGLLNDYISPVDYDDSDVKLEGDEYWSYGGHEHHSDYLETKYFIDETKEEAIKEYYENKRLKKEREEQAKQLELDKKREQDLKLLNELKQKYES